MMHLLNKHSLRRILHFTFRRNTCAGTMQYAQLLIQCSCMNGRHASGSADVSEISAQGKESVEILGFCFFFRWVIESEKNREKNKHNSELGLFLTCKFACEGARLSCIMLFIVVWESCVERGNYIGEQCAE